MYFYYVSISGKPCPVKAADHPTTGLEAKRKQQNISGPIYKLTVAQAALSLAELTTIFPHKESADDQR